MDAAKAATRPRPDLHSIWELVLHITAWQKMALQSLEGNAYVSMTGEEDWPTVPADPTEDAWQTARAAMAELNDRLVEAIRAFPEERLDETVPGGEFGFYLLLHGVAQHNIYHAGQIAILKRL